jgi:hypothetical protein
MTDLRQRLRDSDPLQHESGLSAEEIKRMRRALAAAAHAAPVAGGGWRWPVGIIAFAALTVAAGLMLPRRMPAEAVDGGGPRSALPAGSDMRTQVHFSTPGGTRIVWTLDPDFQLRETRR